MAWQPLYVYALISFCLPIRWEVDSWLRTGRAEERQIALSHLLACVVTKSTSFPCLQISPDPRDPHQLTVTVLEQRMGYKQKAKMSQINHSRGRHGGRRWMSGASTLQKSSLQKSCIPWHQSRSDPEGRR